MSAPVTPGQGQGLGCSLVVGAVVVAANAVYLAVHLIVWAVR